MGYESPPFPESKIAYVFNTLGRGYADPSSKIKDMLRQSGYVPYLSPSNGMTVEDLLNVKDVGVLYINSQSGFTQIDDNTTLYVIATSTEVTPENDEKYKDDFTALKPRLVKMTTSFELNPDGSDADKHVVYGITENFVAENMKFDNNSFVFIDCCNSQNIQASGFIKAFIDKKATYVGWDDFVQSPCAYSRALYLVDRLLGINDIGPYPNEKPPKKPKSLQSTIAEMKIRLDDLTGLYWNQCKALPTPANPNPPTIIAELKFTCPPNIDLASDDLFLVPVIYYLSFCEEIDELFIIGPFGNIDKRTMTKVTISENEDGDGNGEILPIVKWLSDYLHCKINISGVGSAGYVQIEFDSRKSNVVPLTLWTMSLVYTTKDNDECAMTARFNVFFRVYLLENCHVGKLKFSKDSKGQWQDSGMVKYEHSTRTWNGQGFLLPDYSYLDFPDNTFSSDDSMEEEPNIIIFPFWFQASGGHWEEIRDNGIRGSGTLSYRAFLELKMEINSSDYSIEGGKIDKKLPKGSCSVEWTKTEVKYPPSPKTKI